jgi:hypothetical protein
VAVRRPVMLESEEIRSVCSPSPTRSFGANAAYREALRLAFCAKHRRFSHSQEK